MSDCCKPTHNKHICPSNGQVYKEVPRSTLMHHIKEPWAFTDSHQKYFFCDDPDCDVVYFAEDNSVIKQADLRTELGIKSQSERALICYCFGVSKHQAINDPSIKDFVVKLTKDKVCACATRNPSGKCCLRDFP